MNAIEIKNVYKSFEKFKLDNITLNLPSGCVMGLIGENGAGKSTLIELVTGIKIADSGKIAVLGTDNRSNLFTETKEKIGVVLSRHWFYSSITAKKLNKIMQGFYREWNEDLFFDYIRRFNIDLKQKFKHYSKGMKAKLEIAVALSHKAKLLIFDEPMSGLDPVARDEFIDIINDYTKTEDTSVLISSHLLTDLEKMCDYITYISDGKLVCCEEKDELCERYIKVKCSEEELQEIDSNKIIGIRKTEFGIEALAERTAVHTEIHSEKASIEDIMIYVSKMEGD